MPGTSIPSSQQKTTAAEEMSPKALGIPAGPQKHLYRIYSNSTKKVKSSDFIDTHEQGAKPQGWMHLPKD